MIVLDTGPLGLLVHSKAATAQPCLLWMLACLKAGRRFVIPEIALYELKRELLRMENRDSLTRLDEFLTRYDYLPITTAAINRAAEFWADARRTHQPMADNKALDGDVILCAQVDVMPKSVVAPIIATTNVGHLSRFAKALLWQEITPF